MPREGLEEVLVDETKAEVLKVVLLAVKVVQSNRRALKALQSAYFSGKLIESPVKLLMQVSWLIATVDFVILGPPLPFLFSL